MVKLVLKVYDRINRHKDLRLVRWSVLGEFHLVRVRLAPDAICGVKPGRIPHRYIRGEDGPAEVCEACWVGFTAGGPVEQRELR